jgi:hypothetical protein
MAGFMEKMVLGMTISQLVTNIIIAAILIGMGIAIGFLVKYLLNRVLEKADFKNSQKSFMGLFVSVVRWSIYILFLNFALIRLGIPQFTDWLTNILVVIPALFGALILIGVGFAIASYLKEVIEDSRISGWKVLSEILFIFVNYIFIVFAFKTAFISLDSGTVNVLVVIITAALAAGFAIWYVRK